MTCRERWRKDISRRVGKGGSRTKEQTLVTLTTTGDVLPAQGSEKDHVEVPEDPDEIHLALDMQEGGGDDGSG